MKYLKLFEELSPETYIRAGQKLKSKGHYKRGNNLINYATNLRNKDVVYDPTIYKYNILSSQTIYKCKFVDYEINLIYGDSVSELVDSNNSIGYIF